MPSLTVMILHRKRPNLDLAFFPQSIRKQAPSYSSELQPGVACLAINSLNKLNGFEFKLIPWPEAAIPTGARRNRAEWMASSAVQGEGRT